MSETTNKPTVATSPKADGSQIRWVRVLAKGVDIQFKCTKVSEEIILQAAFNAAITDYSPNTKLTDPAP